VEAYVWKELREVHIAREVADRVYRLGAELVNWYIVEDGGKLTVIDAGNPNQYDQLPAAVSELGLAMDDVEAIVLTHAHGDHLGSSARIKKTSGASVHVHHDDAALARGEAHREYERHYVRDLHHGFAWKSLMFFLSGGATKAPPVHELVEFDDGETLDLPGNPRVIFTPGHTDGSSCLELTDRNVLFTGDALVTLSIVTGERTPVQQGQRTVDELPQPAQWFQRRPDPAGARRTACGKGQRGRRSGPPHRAELTRRIGIAARGREATTHPDQRTR